MKRVLSVLVAAGAATAIGLTGVGGASAAPTTHAPKTNAAAIAAVKRTVHNISEASVVKLYRSLAPKQHKLLSQKQFTRCYQPSLKRVGTEKVVSVVRVGTSVRTVVPGYKGKKVTNKRVYARVRVTNKGKSHTDTQYADVVYVSNDFHWYLSLAQIRQCKGA